MVRYINLTCYSVLIISSEFGLYVGKHGEPSRSAGTIEWEGTAERVALHAPYILLFDSRFIEVRHLETGRLAQIIPGNDVRCLWDGRGVSSPSVATPEPGRDDPIQEARVHAVMNAVEPVQPPGTKPSRAVAQNVFELIPTIPLFLPEPLGTPAATSYFTQPSYSSPPQTPQSRVSGSWR